MRSASRRPLLFLLALALIGLSVFLALTGGLISEGEARPGYKYLIGISVADGRIPWVRAFIEELEQQKDAWGEGNVLIRESLGSAEQQRRDVGDLLKHEVDLLIVVPRDASVVSAYAELGVATPCIVVGSETLRGELLSAGLAPEGRAAPFYFVCFDVERSAALLAAVLEEHAAGPGDLLLLYDPRSELDLARVAALERRLGEDWRIERALAASQGAEAKNRMIDHIVVSRDARLVVAGSAELAYGAYSAMRELRAEDFRFFAFDRCASVRDLSWLEASLAYTPASSRVQELAERILAQARPPAHSVLEPALITER